VNAPFVHELVDQVCGINRRLVFGDHELAGQGRTDLPHRARLNELLPNESRGSVQSEEALQVDDSILLRKNEQLLSDCPKQKLVVAKISWLDQVRDIAPLLSNTP